jgi:hypothetical protein
MENLLFNLDSVESSYGENVLNTVIQIDERISDIAEFVDKERNHNDFELSEVTDRLNRLIQKNRDAQMELERQVQRIEHIKQNLELIDADFSPQSRYLINYKH